MLPFRRRRRGLAGSPFVPVVRRRRLRRLAAFGAATAGVLAWRERQLTRNNERYGPPAG